MADKHADVRIEYGVNRFWEMAATNILKNDAKTRNYKTFSRYCRHFGMAAMVGKPWEDREIQVSNDTLDQLAVGRPDRRRSKGRQSGAGARSITVENGYER